MEMEKLLKAIKIWKNMIAKWADHDDDAIIDETAFADFYDDGKEKCAPFNHHVPRKPRSQLVTRRRSNCKQEINGYVLQEISRKTKKRRFQEVMENSYGGTINRPKKNRGIRQLAPQVLLPNPPLPQNLKDYIDNLNLVRPPLFVANKVLKKTDLNPGQSRLSFPEIRVGAEFINSFLSEGEKADLQRKNDIGVSFVDERLQEYHDLYLRRWSLTSSSLYVFKRGWNRMVKKNQFREEKDIVQVWGFRVEQRLWFALFTTPAY